MILPKFTKRERTLTLITIIIVFSTISYGFIIEPFVRAYSRFNRQIAAKSSKLRKNYRLLKREDLIKREYEKYARFIKPLPSDEEEIAAMLSAIEAIGRGNNIYITNIRPQPAKERVYYKEFSFELISEADIDKLVKFIYDLQTSGNLLRVKKLTISASSSKKHEVKAVMEITKPAFSL